MLSKLFPTFLRTADASMPKGLEDAECIDLSGVADMTTADLWELAGTAPNFLAPIGWAAYDLILAPLADCLTEAPATLAVGIAAVKSDWDIVYF
jgi:hypothetical protein